MTEFYFFILKQWRGASRHSAYGSAHVQRRYNKPRLRLAQGLKTPIALSHVAHNIDDLQTYTYCSIYLPIHTLPTNAKSDFCRATIASALSSDFW